jgi:hypothetical protein
MDKQAKTPGEYPRRVQEGTRRLVHDLIEEAEKARALCATLRGCLPLGPVAEGSR